jgi:PleD family two-component response regulator
MPGNGRSSPPPRILVANDREWALRALESILAPRGYAVLRAYTPRQAFELAVSGQPDTIILDCGMAEIGGIEICRRLSADPEVGGTMPMILTTGNAERDERLAALQAGAWDYCAQPLDAEVLLLKIGTFVRAKRAADHAREEGLLDEASGLYSIRGLARRAREIGADAGRRGAAVACIAFGPDAESVDGRDRILREASGRVAGYLGDVCRRTGRASDAIGRMGPAEFAIVAPATEAAGARQLAARLIAAVEDRPLEIEGSPFLLTVRVGYAAVTNLAEASIDAVELLFRATGALRTARADRDGSAIRSFDDSASRGV